MDENCSTLAPPLMPSDLLQCLPCTSRPTVIAFGCAWFATLPLWCFFLTVQPSRRKVAGQGHVSSASLCPGVLPCSCALASSDFLSALQHHGRVGA